MPYHRWVKRPNGRVPARPVMVLCGLGLVAILVVVGLVLHSSPAPTPSPLPGLAVAQLSATDVSLQKPDARQAAAAIGATAARHAVLSAFPHRKLLGSVLAVYKNSLTKEDCLCWLFNTVPAWGLHSVGGPRLTTCYANSGVLTFFVVVVVARTGKLLDEVGGTTRADGSPLPRGPKVSCRASISPAP
jgi:hypothetical protein